MQEKPLVNNWFRVALLNFLLAALIGCLLRYAFVEEISWMQYRPFMHAHSHVAMLGWVYLALFALLVKRFLPETRQASYRWIFWLTQFSVFGMLICFPIWGYAGISIVFSTLHILFSYIFLLRFWRDLNKYAKGQPGVLWIRTALLLMVLSTLALWAMAPIILLGHAGSAFYYASIQFFLHFQFNGWFIFAILGLFFHWSAGRGFVFPKKKLGWFYGLLLSSCLLTYVLAVTWSNPIPALFWINSLGVLLQLGALGLLLQLIRPHWKTLGTGLGKIARLLLFIAFIAFFLKILVQTAVVVPTIATVAYTIRNFVLGFIHLLLLGLVTSYILGAGLADGLWKIRSNIQRLAFYCLLAGIVLTELLLFSQGLLLWIAQGFMPYYHEGIFLASCLLPLGIGGLLLAPRKNT